MGKNGRKKTDPSRPKESGSFDLFWRVFDLLGVGGDPERAKRRQLKEIGKQLKRQKYNFYKPKSGEALPDLAKFFYDIYRAVAPAKILIQHAEASHVLKSIVIERYLTETQRAIRQDFDEEVIRKRIEEVGPKTLASEYKEKLLSFLSGFDNATVCRINDAYNLLIVFLQFINFDYYFAIKKFDSLLPENDFKYRPRFEAINGEYIGDDLKDFLEVAPLVDPKAEWASLFEMLEVYKGAPVMTEKSWRAVLSKVTDVVASGVLVLIVRHIDGNPSYSNTFTVPNNRIVEEYLNKIKNQTEITIQKILNERRASKIDSLAQAVFGTSSVSRMRNYTEKANIAFAKKMLGGYTYVEPMNYLKAFLLDYLKSDIKNVVDVLLIRGQWAAPVLSQQLSESFHRLLEMTQDLLGFDERLSDDGQRGAAIKNALMKSDREKSMIRVLRQYLDEANQEALRIIRESARNLVAVAKHLKAVLDDHRNKRSDVIMNWREIEVGFDKDIDVEISTIYKKIYYLTQLLQYFIKTSE